MYQALRHFKNRLSDGSIVALQPGDDVEGFDTWPARYQQAALSTHMVRVRPADPSRASLDARPSHEDVRCWTYDAMQKAMANQRAQQAVTRPAAEAVVEDASVELVSAEPEADVTETLQCPHCEFSTVSSQGFKTHQARKHRD